MDRRKTLWTVLVLTAVAAALSGYVDDVSGSYAESAFKRALVTFAVARTLNGVISAAQGTEIALEPGGVGVNLSVGEVLDPINDLIEQFSTVMLVATSSLGLQNILLKMTSWWGVTAALVIFAVLALASIWSPRLAASKYVAVISRVFLVVLFIRFAVPLLILGTNMISETFLASEQAAATEALNATRNDIEQIDTEMQAAPDADQSLMDRLGSMIADSMAYVDPNDRVTRLKESVSNASEHIVNLIVIFVLQTIILPLVFLWLFVETMKSIAARSIRL